MRKLVVTAALVLTFVSSTRAETPTWMTPGPGQDETAVSCGVCHTVNYIKMNSPFLKPDVWKAEVDKMRTVFAAPIDDDTAATILTYLNKNFGIPASK
jgi:mono/diheme cytochrome c family protein